jgi:SAM-dependent methyltransferase
MGNSTGQLSHEPAPLDQSGLDAHFRTFYRTQKSDFRAANITQLALSKLDRSGSVLDVGCGSCVLTRQLLRDGFDVTSADVSPEMLHMARECLEDEGLSASGLHHMDIAQCRQHFGAIFDQVVCLDVIEHIADDATAVRDLVGLLKPSGRLVLSVPSLPSLYGPKDRQVGHYRRYTRKGLLSLCRRHGLHVRDIRYWNGLGVPVSWVSLRVFHRAVNESMRRSDRGPLQAFANSALRLWFRFVENPIRFPLGLTLLLVAEKPLPP